MPRWDTPLKKEYIRPFITDELIESWNDWAKVTVDPNAKDADIDAAVYEAKKVEKRVKCLIQQDLYRKNPLQINHHWEIVDRFRKEYLQLYWKTHKKPEEIESSNDIEVETKKIKKNKPLYKCEWCNKSFVGLVVHQVGMHKDLFNDKADKLQLGGYSVKEIHRRLFEGIPC